MCAHPKPWAAYAYAFTVTFTNARTRNIHSFSHHEKFTAVGPLLLDECKY